MAVVKIQEGTLTKLKTQVSLIKRKEKATQTTKAPAIARINNFCFIMI